MARRRADTKPGLMARVRWANLGRWAALLAAGLIVFTRGCGGDEPGVAVPRVVAPAEVARPDGRSPAARSTRMGLRDSIATRVSRSAAIGGSKRISRRKTPSRVLPRKPQLQPPAQPPARW